VSRSNPHDNGSQNPTARWFEWDGGKGIVRYYDREAKQHVEVGSDFTFSLLDQLGTVGGWHDPSESAIWANEVKDTRQDVMIVKAWKGGTLAEGLYKDIKDRVNAIGGHFVANLYIAFKHGDGLAIGSLKLKGAALGSWMEFTKAHRADIWKQAIRINGHTEGKKGKVVFRMPVFSVKPLSEASNQQATALDMELQAFLKAHLGRNTREQVEAPPPVYGDDAPPDYAAPYAPPITDDDIPF
jgi:hypothetical protein